MTPVLIFFHCDESGNRPMMTYLPMGLWLSYPRLHLSSTDVSATFFTSKPPGGPGGPGQSTEICLFPSCLGIHELPRVQKPLDDLSSEYMLFQVVHDHDRWMDHQCTIKPLLTNKMFLFCHKQKMAHWCLTLVSTLKRAGIRFSFWSPSLYFVGLRD